MVYNFVVLHHSLKSLLIIFCILDTTLKTMNTLYNQLNSVKKGEKCSERGGNKETCSLDKILKKFRVILIYILKIK